MNSYDNQGTDQNEFIEVTGVAGTNLQGYKLVLYSGGTQDIMEP